MQEAMVFGGKTHVTATDIAVAAGLFDIGQSELVKSLPKNLVEGAISEMRRMLEDSVDQIKVRSWFITCKNNIKFWYNLLPW